MGRIFIFLSESALFIAQYHNDSIGSRIEHFSRRLKKGDDCDEMIGKIEGLITNYQIKEKKNFEIIYFNFKVRLQIRRLILTLRFRRLLFNAERRMIEGLTLAYPVFVTVINALIAVTQSIAERIIARQRILPAPGARLLRIATLLYSGKTVEEVFKQAVGDWREDYFDAVSSGDKTRARIVNIRGRYTFLKMMILRSPIGDLLEIIRKIAS